MSGGINILKLNSKEIQDNKNGKNTASVKRIQFDNQSQPINKNNYDQNYSISGQKNQCDEYDQMNKNEDEKNKNNDSALIEFLKSNKSGELDKDGLLLTNNKYINVNYSSEMFKRLEYEITENVTKLGLKRVKSCINMSYNKYYKTNTNKSSGSMAFFLSQKIKQDESKQNKSKFSPIVYLISCKENKLDNDLLNQDFTKIAEVECEIKKYEMAYLEICKSVKDARVSFFGSLISKYNKQTSLNYKNGNSNGSKHNNKISNKYSSTIKQIKDMQNSYYSQNSEDLNNNRLDVTRKKKPNINKSSSTKNKKLSPSKSMIISTQEISNDVLSITNSHELQNILSSDINLDKVPPKSNENNNKSELSKNKMSSSKTAVNDFRLGEPEVRNKNKSIKKEIKSAGPCACSSGVCIIF